MNQINEFKDTWIAQIFDLINSMKKALIGLYKKKEKKKPKTNNPSFFL